MYTKRRNDKLTAEIEVRPGLFHDTTSFPSAVPFLPTCYPLTVAFGALDFFALWQATRVTCATAAQAALAAVEFAQNMVSPFRSSAFVTEFAQLSAGVGSNKVVSRIAHATGWQADELLKILKSRVRGGFGDRAFGCRRHCFAAVSGVAWAHQQLGRPAIYRSEERFVCLCCCCNGRQRPWPDRLHASEL